MSEKSPLVDYLTSPVSDGPMLRGMPRWGVFALVIFLVGAWSLTSRQSPTDAPTQITSGPETAAQVEPAPEVSAEKAEERRKGFHCLSAWDGSNRSLVDQVKGDLNDPGSFEHDKTFISPVGKDGQHPIKMLFMAKNGFGGVIRGAAEGRVDPASCEATLTRIY